MNPNDEYTRDLIFKLIERKGETQQSFADGIDADPTLVAHWKSGISNTFKKYIDKISDHFGVTSDYLLGRSAFPCSNDSAEMNAIIQELRNRPELRKLFYIASSASTDDIDRTIAVITALKGL